MKILNSELQIIYQAFARGQPSPLSEVSIQFADFAAWERQTIHSNFMKQQLTYWTEQLSQLPSDHVASENISFRTGQRALELEEELLARIKSLAHKENCTPFMVLFAALGATIWSFTGLADICVGTLMANRRRKETEITVGNFVNTVILRLRVHPQLNLTELVRQAREVVLRAHANQEYPFARLIAILERQQNINRSSVFNVMLLYQNPPLPTIKTPGLGFAPVNLKHIAPESELTITACDLIFNLVESTTRLAGSLIFKTDKFSDADVGNMTKLFRQTISFMLLEPTQPISALSRHVT
jgi:hypothetical protein